ncbi:hypothetical protein ACKP2L_05130 [Oenococcus alcoholitolerans]|uniref:hypothetical protein n=1 Tax=Oenococcus alcoholitolerans TaxID=931074 RepID=UPI003F6F0DBB
MNWIALITAISAGLSALISAISLWRSYKIQFAESRPYLGAFLVTVENSKMTAAQYLTIKNFGKTSATIKEIKLSKEAKDIENLIPTADRFESLKNFVLAPGQKVSFMTYKLEQLPQKKEHNTPKHKQTDITISYIDDLNKLFIYKGKLNFRFGETEGYFTNKYNFGIQKTSRILADEQIAGNLENIRNSIDKLQN